ncbi:uncharacterized protein LOC119554396 isoform X2 [Drosophila subpulchrella]|uniref:uncharacterized protein LOC119554396 isoform X2 n=1 Tax=Drosophila subpulchrella TaxID=1486046 RepID=UPI0018A167AF|nr:uncharacterized protein LOC119554396 isoform X2 [Drosophila subpulchrella]
MCVCPPIALKIALLLSIAANIVILTVNLVACFIALLFLALGVYGAIMNHIVIIRMLLFVLVVFCLFKIIMWIVCANLSPALSDAVIHIWFMVNTAASSARLLFSCSGCVCMSLHENFKWAISLRKNKNFLNLILSISL